MTHAFQVTAEFYAGLVCPAMQTLVCDLSGLESQWDSEPLDYLRSLLAAFPNLRCLFGPPFEDQLPALQQDRLGHQLCFSFYRAKGDSFHRPEEEGVREAPSKCRCCGEYWIRNGVQVGCRFFRDP